MHPNQNPKLDDPALLASLEAKVATLKAELAAWAAELPAITMANSLGAEDMVLTDVIATGKLPIEVELAASFIQHQCEPAEMVAFTCPLTITTPFETFTLNGPLLVLSFARPESLRLPAASDHAERESARHTHDPNLALPRPLSTDNHDQPNPNHC